MDRRQRTTAGDARTCGTLKNSLLPQTNSPLDKIRVFVQQLQLFDVERGGVSARVSVGHLLVSSRMFSWDIVATLDATTAPIE